MTNPIVSVAKENVSNDITTLSTGIRARLKPVSASLMQEVTNRIKDPPIPRMMNDEKGREEDNPWDPTYIAACNENVKLKAQATMDAMIMFGLELVDGIPDSGNWLGGLKMMERLGHLDLSDFDLENPFDLEFLYKKFIAVGTIDYVLIGKKSGLGIREADVAHATKSFPRDEE